MIIYEPKKLVRPTRLIDVPTAWDGCESVLEDIIERFDITPTFALEFGVQHGYSTAALANYFTHVIGVDTFAGDEMAGFGDSDHTFNATKSALIDFPNVNLARMSYQDWIGTFNGKYDLIHIDIVHTYEDTYACGEWAVGHSDVVIFHDTQSFPDVGRAMGDLADHHGWNFYNWGYQHGLGILTPRSAK